MTQPTRLDLEYYEWLISQIDVPKDKTYGGLFEQMHNLEFVWTVPNDDNRLHDGLNLRTEWLQGSNQTLDLGPATFLEVLVALSRRVAFIDGGDPEKWAWQLMKNIHVHGYTDELPVKYPDQILDRLNTVVWRLYRSDGHGGFFPLKDPIEDQTKVEIWSQMNAYIIERTT